MPVIRVDRFDDPRLAEYRTVTDGELLRRRHRFVAEGRLVVARLLESVRQLTVRHGPHEVKVTLSVGLAALRPGESVSGWIARADAALYRAKREGRDTYRLGP
jgi:PleD family two-component response regulator